MRLRYLTPNLITAANIVAGFSSMFAAADGRFDTAVHLLLVAMLLDLSDGRVARALGATSRFGQELDSLSDAISFCAAPAFLAQRALLGDLGALGAAAATAYLLTGVLRLARFNITSEPAEKAARTVGVPTPVATGYVMVVVLMRAEIPPPVAAVVVGVLAVGMVSRVPLPELGGRGIVPATMMIGIVNYFVLVAFPNWLTVGWWNLWNVVILATAHWDTRRRERAQVAVS